MSSTSADIAWPAWGAAPSRGGMLSLFRFGSRGPDPRDQHHIEKTLLEDGGLTVAEPPKELAKLEDPGPEACSQKDSATTLRPGGQAGAVAQLEDVVIDSTGNYIHTLAIRGDSAASSQEAAPRHNLVLTHGYFTGLGFFFRNYHELSQVEGWDIYAIDWLGMGRSSRSAYVSKRAESEDSRVSYAESYFVESLEEWRKRVGIERMTLCGHSFGGYMSALYALKYPQHVEKLVLISPIGVPEQPPDYDTRLRQGYGPARNRRTDSNDNDTPEYQDAGEGADDVDRPSTTRAMMLRLVMNLWERNYAPQWVIRTAGPFGRRLIDSYVNRFAWLSEAQRQALANYTHQITTLPGSSESALGDILRPGAFARRPLVDRLTQIAMPTTFLYGANDWVDHASGEQVIRRIGERVRARLYRIPLAGHNLHLENPADFNKVLIDEMRAVSS
ncbi:hypothetical protein GGF46_000837 [Coemansia sp. RSA 552]|nr:hypothetical protein GGF46_000837 [Coemansia sp. RSA 552]